MSNGTRAIGQHVVDLDPRPKPQPDRPTCLNCDGYVPTPEPRTCPHCGVDTEAYRRLVEQNERC